MDGAATAIWPMKVNIYTKEIRLQFSNNANIVLGVALSAKMN